MNLYKPNQILKNIVEQRVFDVQHRRWSSHVRIEHQQLELVDIELLKLSFVILPIVCESSAQLKVVWSGLPLVQDWPSAQPLFYTGLSFSISERTFLPGCIPSQAAKSNSSLLPPRPLLPLVLTCAPPICIVQSHALTNVICAEDSVLDIHIAISLDSNIYALGLCRQHDLLRAEELTRKWKQSISICCHVQRPFLYCNLSYKALAYAHALALSIKFSFTHHTINNTSVIQTTC